MASADENIISEETSKDHKHLQEIIISFDSDSSCDETDLTLQSKSNESDLVTENKFSIKPEVQPEVMKILQIRLRNHLSILMMNHRKKMILNLASERNRKNLEFPQCFRKKTYLARNRLQVKILSLKLE